MQNRIEKKPFAILAGAAALGLLLAAMPTGGSYARNLGAAVGGGANVGVGAGGTHGAAGAGAGGNAGGSSSSHMSNEGLSNTNGPNASDRDTGLGRAEDRANEEGTENGKAFEQNGDVDTSVHGKAKLRGNH